MQLGKYQHYLLKKLEKQTHWILLLHRNIAKVHEIFSGNKGLSYQSQVN